MERLLELVWDSACKIYTADDIDTDAMYLGHLAAAK